MGGPRPCHRATRPRRGKGTRAVTPAESRILTPHPRDVLEYAGAITQTPPTVTDNMAAADAATRSGRPIELTTAAAQANLYSRTKSALGTQSYCSPRRVTRFRYQDTPRQKPRPVRPPTTASPSQSPACCSEPPRRRGRGAEDLATTTGISDAATRCPTLAQTSSRYVTRRR
jgi:hypothetical protein